MIRALHLVALLLVNSALADEHIESVFSFNGNRGDNDTYFVNLPENAYNFSIESSEGVGDVDIFVYSPNEIHHLDFSFCSNRRQTSLESCFVGMPDSGSYRIVARSYQHNSSANIRISYFKQSARMQVGSKPVVFQSLLAPNSPQNISFKTARTFKTYFDPNRKAASIEFFEFNMDILVRIRDDKSDSQSSTHCEFILEKHHTDSCTILSPAGGYLIEVAEISNRKSDPEINGTILISTEVDQAVIEDRLRDPNTKALHWNIPKLFDQSHGGKTFVYEARPNVINLSEILDHNIAKIWNGLVVDKTDIEATIENEQYESVDYLQCRSISFQNETKCNYDKDMAENIEWLRLTLTLPNIISSPVLLMHKQTDTEMYTNPSPTCPIDRGCDGDPEI